MAMTTAITTKKTKTTEEMAAAASTLENNSEHIADLIASLTRDILLRRSVEVDVNNISVDQEKDLMMMTTMTVSLRHCYRC